jgi:pimeloyl-ACP methyl ester carboxylesterase
MGASDKPADGYALADLADEAASVISALGVKEYILVGHSLGGKVAQLLASRNPVGLKGLLLVAPAPPTPLRFPEEMKQTQIHAYDNRQNVLQTIYFLSAIPSSSLLVEQIVEDSMSGSREATLAYPTASILEDISEEVSHIAVPTLLVAGELDQLDSIEQHEREVIARIPGSMLTVIEGSGHLIPIDQPGRLADRILNFVSTLGD